MTPWIFHGTLMAPYVPHANGTALKATDLTLNYSLFQNN